ncbi:MAG: alpha/beta fold hydrolase [Chthoniobacterales bacterium]
MPKYWLISDRNNGGVGGGMNNAGLTYWVSDGGDLTNIANWKKTSAANFQSLLADAADQFPDNVPNEQQSHVTILVHGFNVDFQHSTSFYQKISDSLFAGANSLSGLCVLYDWPSLGSLLGYEPDRAHARACAADLADVLCVLFDYMVKKQSAAIKNPADACKAKVSMIAHSMGNYVLQKAMASAWTRKNQPLLASLLNQLVMVAADVDNDLFDAGAPDNNDGAAIANLTYRITALYSGKDSVLGMSAGLKHFGTRRLGRAGLAHHPPLVTQLPETDNVWDVDCSSFFAPDLSGEAIHGAYFDTPGVIELMRQILRGIDRRVLQTTGATVGAADPRFATK